jgi:chromosome segregation ATPase
LCDPAAACSGVDVVDVVVGLRARIAELQRSSDESRSRLAELEATLADYQNQDAHESMECYRRTKELEAALAEAREYIAEIREPLLDYIGTTDPHEVEIQLRERYVAAIDTARND